MSDKGMHNASEAPFININSFFSPQAFLEMEDEQSASSMVNYFTNCVAQLRERSVYVQFSTHKELKTDQTHSNASASAQAALQAAQALTGEAGPGQTGTAGAGNNKAPGGGPNTVLRVIVEHMVYPVTLDVIYQIFSRVGKVLKIVTFTKNNTFQVSIAWTNAMWFKFLTILFFCCRR